MFVINDGEHRACSQIYEGKNEITGLYIDYIYAVKALETPFQMCAYCINEDYWKIKYSIGKVNDSKLFKSTNIINHHIFLENISIK